MDTPPWAERPLPEPRGRIREVSASRIGRSFCSRRATPCHAVIQEGHQGPDLTSRNLQGTSKSGTIGSPPQALDAGRGRAALDQGHATPGRPSSNWRRALLGAGRGQTVPGRGRRPEAGSPASPAPPPRLLPLVHVPRAPPRGQSRHLLGPGGRRRPQRRRRRLSCPLSASSSCSRPARQLAPGRSGVDGAYGWNSAGSRGAEGRWPT